MSHELKCPKCYKKVHSHEMDVDMPSGLHTAWYCCPVCGKWSPEEEWAKDKTFKVRNNTIWNSVKGYKSPSDMFREWGL